MNINIAAAVLGSFMAGAVFGYILACMFCVAARSDEQSEKYLRGCRAKKEEEGNACPQ